MPVKNNNNHGIASSLSRREEFVGVVLVAVVLSVGTNLITSSVVSSIPSHRSHILWIGIMCVVGPLIYLLVRLLAARGTSYAMEAVFVVDPKKNQLVGIPGYELSEHLSQAVEAAFLENAALRSAWEKEPLVTRDEWYEDSVESSGNDGQDPDDATGKSREKDVSYFTVVRVDVSEPETKRKSEILLGEAIEFVILNVLSMHLSAYFRDYPGTDKMITEYTRQDVPSLLLDNRVLSLLSTPLEDRAIFRDCSFANEPPSGEIESVYGSDGSIYNRFSLILPKGTRVSRPSPGVLRLENDRIVLELAIRYERFSANLPLGFAEGLLGETNGRLNPRLVEITFTAKMKLQAVLKGRGWQYHEWVDSFAKRLQEYASFDDFLEHIGWQIVFTNLQATGRLFSRRLVAHSDDTRK